VQLLNRRYRFLFRVESPLLVHLFSKSFEIGVIRSSQQNPQLPWKAAKKEARKHNALLCTSGTYLQHSSHQL
jgi:hypothetical protein